MIGGGPTGVEVAADLADFLSGDAKEAQQIGVLNLGVNFAWINAVMRV